VGLYLEFHSAAALEVLAQRFAAQSRTWLSNLHLKENDLEDAVHDGWIRVQLGLSRFDRQKGSFLGWCRTVVRNEAISMLRKARRATPGGALETVPDGKTDPTEELAQALEQEFRLAIICEAQARVEKRFPPEEVAIFRLTLQGRKPAEISEQLAVPVKTVYTTNFQMRQAIRAEADELLERGPNRLSPPPEADHE
jgi:RNA polymerase sigma factor (sigma-70 family)